jgi:RNA-binding protein YhbY
MTRRSWWRLPSLIAFPCLLLTGCQRTCPPPSGPTPAPLPAGQRAVRLLVEQDDAGNTLAFVPVTINGHGPYRFTLDTGASISTIDAELAHDLHLPEDGSPVKVAGVGAVTEAIPVRVEHWRVGDIELPARRIVRVHLPEPDRKAGMKGLLGSDILSRFGAILVDYRGEVLVLHPKDQLASGSKEGNVP